VSSGKDRVLIWYQGRGGAGQRFAFRLGNILHGVGRVGSVSYLLNEADSYIDLIRESGDEVVSHVSPSGRDRPLALLASIPARLRRFSEALDRLKPDVVVCAMNFALAWPLVEILRWRGIPNVYVCHDPEPHVGDYGVLWQRVSQKIMLKRASAIVALSGYGRDELLKTAPAAIAVPIVMIPLQDHMSALRRREPRRLAAAGRVRFLCLGRLIAYKGFDLLAEAIARLGERTDWSLTIAGDGPLKDEVVRLFAHDPRVDLTRLHLLSEGEIDDLVSTHDVIIHAYKEATQSGTLTEALLEGMPSIVTPVGALPEQIGNGSAGWISPEVSAEGVAAAIVAAITDAQAGRYEDRSLAALALCDGETARAGWRDVLDAVLPAGGSVRRPG